MGNVTVELELTDGSKVIDTFDKEKIYGLRSCISESVRCSYSWKWPFVRVLTVKKEYSQFKYRTEYTYINSNKDKTYNVNCGVSALARILEIMYKPFAKSVLGDAIING